MIVVDVGALDWVGDASIEKLVERFDPDALFAFDPYPEFVEKEWTLGRTRVVQIRSAAWTFAGEIGFRADGTSSRISAFDAELVQCFDLALFLDGLVGEEIVLKLDCEGAEYALLERLVERGVDLRLNRILVEWHDDWWKDASVTRRFRSSIAARIRCPVEDWH